MIEKGILGHREQMVTPDLTADRIATGLVQVFATPMLVALMEQTCNSSRPIHKLPVPHPSSNTFIPSCIS